MKCYRSKLSIAAATGICNQNTGKHIDEQVLTGRSEGFGQFRLLTEELKLFHTVFQGVGGTVAHLWSSNYLFSPKDQRYFARCRLQDLVWPECLMIGHIDNKFVSHCSCCCRCGRRVLHNRHEWMMCLFAVRKFGKINLSLKSKRVIFGSVIFAFCEILCENAFALELITVLIFKFKNVVNFGCISWTMQCA